MLSQERVIGAARDRIGVERGLPAPALERTNGTLAAQVRDDQRAIDTLRREKLVLGERLESREPIIVRALARGEPVGAEITETIVVGMDSGDGGRDGIERVAPVYEIVGVLAEARELERLSAVGAELGIGRVWPSTVAAVDRRAGRRGGSAGRRTSGDGGGLVIRRFVAEAADALAQLTQDVRKLPRPEDDQHDREDEKKLGTTNTRHRSLPSRGLLERLDLPVYACP
jgi:hypothetical protein